MKLIVNRLHLPVLRQPILVNVHSQGKPTAFEKMAVSFVKTGQTSEELREHSIASLFEFIVGNDSANIFLDETLDRLFSPAIAVLRVASDVSYSSYRDLPVKEIEVLPNGEELLRSGLFPTQARTIRRTVLFNPISRNVSEAAEDAERLYPVDQSRALPETLATSVWPGEEIDAFVKKTLLRPGDVLSGISRMEEGRVEWSDATASLELEDGELKAKSSVEGVADYLNGLRPEEFARLMLGGLESVRSQGPARNLDGIATSDIFSPVGRISAPDSWVWLHPDGVDAAPKNVRLEVIWPVDGQASPGKNSFSVGAGGAPDRLFLSDAPYPDKEASGDLHEFCHIVTGRAFFARTPLEIPIGLRERLSDESSAEAASIIITALRESGHPRAHAHADAMSRLSPLHHDNSQKEEDRK